MKNTLSLTFWIYTIEKSLNDSWLSLVCYQADAGLLKAHLRMGTAYWKLGDLTAATEKYTYVAAQPSPPAEVFAKLDALKSFIHKKSLVFACLSALLSISSIDKAENLPISTCCKSA